jgi:hypothetical protein
MTKDKQDAKTTQNSEKNTEVVIHLDRPRFVKFGHKALKQLGVLTGKKMSQLDEAEFDMADLEAVMYCGLMADARENNEDLKLEQMEDLLDLAETFNDIVEVMNNALAQAFQKTEKQKN